MRKKSRLLADLYAIVRPHLENALNRAVNKYLKRIFRKRVTCYINPEIGGWAYAKHVRTLIHGLHVRHHATTPRELSGKLCQ